MFSRLGGNSNPLFLCSVTPAILWLPTGEPPVLHNDRAPTVMGYGHKQMGGSEEGVSLGTFPGL